MWMSENVYGRRLQPAFFKEDLRRYEEVAIIIISRRCRLHGFGWMLRRFGRL